MMRARRVVAGSMGIAVVLGATLGGFVRRFAVREASMEPTLTEGDWILAHRRAGVPNRGDIVVFISPSDAGRFLVKRVIGLPHEHVGVAGGRVTINGALLADRWATGSSGPDGSWDVPDGHVWLLGDNRARSSADGRTEGPTSLDRVGWTVRARYWPTTRAGLLN
jgi:signal peptidase I